MKSTNDAVTEAHRKKKIQALSRIVRKKYLALKLGKSEEDAALQKIFQPLSEPLQQIANIKKERTLSKIKKEEIKKEDNEKDGEDINEEVFEEPPVRNLIDNYPEVAHKVIQDFWNKLNKIDVVYGPLFDEGTWYLGGPTTLIKLDKSTGDIIIKNKRFKGTKGLYELIFYKDPQYEDDDLIAYKNILILSNAHRDTLGRLKSSGLDKYKNIIKPMFVKRMTSASTSTHMTRSGSASSNIQLGKGIIYNEKPVEYVYWDDVNELVDRLKLLLASKQAGNTSNDNEIIAIENELREAGIIK